MSPRMSAAQEEARSNERALPARGRKSRAARWQDYLAIDRGVVEKRSTKGPQRPGATTLSNLSRYLEKEN